MENFSKVLSFILGLVVVVIAVAVFSGRLNLGKFVPLTKGLTGKTAQVSPTPTQTPGGSSPQTSPEYNRYQTTAQNTNQTGTIAAIPKTGSPTLLQPILFSTVLLGLYLSRIKGK